MNRRIADKVILFCNCPICYRRLADPISLECGHTFCANCIDSFLSLLKLTASEYKCPECHKELKIYPRNKSWLTKNSIVSYCVLGSLKNSCRLCGQICESCCITCKILLCENCASAHIIGKYKSHTIKCIEQVQKEYCYNHGYAKKYFCLDDKVFLCLVCRINHKFHNILVIPDAVSLLSEESQLISANLANFLCSLPSPLQAKVAFCIEIILSQQNPLKTLQYFYQNLSLASNPIASQENAKLYYIERNSPVLYYSNLYDPIIGRSINCVFPKWCGLTVLPNNRILITGGKSSKNEGSTTDLFILNSKYDIELSGGMINSHSSHGALLVGSKVYILAGKTEDNVAGDHCETFDIHTFESDLINNMKYARTCPGVAAINDHIYVCGGFVRSISNIIERYSIIEGFWIELQVKLPVKLFQLGVVAVDDAQILVFGGEITSEIKNTQSFIFNTKTMGFGMCRNMTEESWLGSWYHVQTYGHDVYSMKKKVQIKFNLDSTVWSSQEY